MVRSDIIRELVEANSQIPPAAIEAAITTAFDRISRQLIAGGRVELRGFGSFTTKQRGARVARDPKNGAPVDVSAKRVVYFRASRNLLTVLNDPIYAKEITKV